MALTPTSDTSQRFLIINPFGIGDVLFTTPVIRAIRSAHPASTIGYLCNRRTEPILRSNPHLNDIFVYEKDELNAAWQRSTREGWRELRTLLGRIRERRYSVAIDLSIGERYGLVASVLGIRRRIGFDFRRRGRFLTEALTMFGYQSQHVVKYYRDLLHFAGFECQDMTLECHPAQDDRDWADAWLDQHQLDPARDLLVGMIPAGGVSWGISAPFRRWSVEGFGDVGSALAAQRHARILLFGEVVDQPYCQSVATRIRQGVIDASGQTNLGRFVALLGRLHLVVCNDGGPLHLAVSQGVRTVSVFGPVNPIVYGPFPTDPRLHRAIALENLPCRPCYHQFRLPPCPYDRACLRLIDADEVLEACHALLDQRDKDA